MPQTKFEELFRSAQRSAYHLEMRDAYGLDKDYQEWSAGHRFDPAERWPWWIDLVSSAVARGVAVHRARIVSEPISAYIRYEYELTSGHNMKAGRRGTSTVHMSSGAASNAPGCDVRKSR